MKKLEISQMENLQGGSVKHCNLVAGLLGGLGGLHIALGGIAATFSIGCLISDL